MADAKDFALFVHCALAESDEQLSLNSFFHSSKDSSSQGSIVPAVNQIVFRLGLVGSGSV
jgi:hypothetical protein